jgi:hypothetical protein
MVLEKGNLPLNHVKGLLEGRGLHPRASHPHWTNHPRGGGVEFIIGRRLPSFQR